MSHPHPPPPPWLTDDEILGLCEPLTQKAAILRYFRAHGFPNCEAKPNGMPLIIRSHFESVQAARSGAASAPAPAGNATDPSRQPDVQGYLKKLGERSKSGHVREKV